MRHLMPDLSIFGTFVLRDSLAATTMTMQLSPDCSSKMADLSVNMNELRSASIFRLLPRKSSWLQTMPAITLFSNPGPDVSVIFGYFSLWEIISEISASPKILQSSKCLILLLRFSAFSVPRQLAENTDTDFLSRRYAGIFEDSRAFLTAIRAWS